MNAAVDVAVMVGFVVLVVGVVTVALLLAGEEESHD